jgi:Mycothiol maleylpyruvate isomerase N-terminal domain
MSLPPEIRELAAAQVDATRDLVAGLSDADLVADTGCAGWLVAHLLVHVRPGLEEIMGSFTEPTGKPADREFLGERAAQYPVFG